MGNEIFIIGAGNSLQGFDFSQLKGKRVMAINMAYKDMELTKDDYLVWIDRSFFFRNKDDIMNLPCKKYVPDFTPDLAYPQSINVVKSDTAFWGKDGLKMGVYCGEGGGNLSGLFAISLASALGYNPIYLLGFDGGEYKGRLHYHNRYDRERDTISAKNRLFYKIKNAGVYNCSLKSNINAFPKVKLKDALSGKPITAIPKQEAIWIHGYLGFGDQLNIRPFVIELCKKKTEVYLTTPFPELYWEKPKNLYFVKPNTHLRLQKKNIEAQPDDIWAYPPYGVEPFYFSYSKGLNILDELGKSLLGTEDYKIDYSLPINYDWVAKAKRVLSKIHTKKKICVIKLPTVRQEWKVTSRLPKPEYIQYLIDNYKDKYYFISVADIEKGKDEYYGEYKGINKRLDNVDIWTTVGLFFLSDMLIGYPSFFIPLSIMLKKKAFCIFGGYNRPENYLNKRMDLRKFNYAAPEPFCNCLLHEHNCNKDIPEIVLKTEFEKVAR